MRRERGFTLLEGMFSLLLVLLVMGALAKTLVNAGKVRANRENMDRAVDEGFLLQGMRADLQGATAILEPAGNGSGAVLRLRTVDPTLSFLQRIEATRGAVSAFDAGEQIEIGYSLVDGALQRSVVPVGGTAPRVTRLAPATTFEVARQDQLISLTVRFEYSRVAKSRTLKVELR